MSNNATYPTQDFASIQSTSARSTSTVDSIAKLGWILIRHRWISPLQLQESLNAQLHCSKQLGELLVEYSLISEGQLKQALREQYWRRNGYWVIE